MSSYPDIPVACLQSGLVMLLEMVVDPMTMEHCVQRVYVEGQKAEIEGFPCPACRIQFDVEQIPPVVLPAGKPSCRYRPLRGPLFVPR